LISFCPAGNLLAAGRATNGFRVIDKLNSLKKAILTGGNGFIGARTVLHLLDAGWHVAALGRSKDGSSWPQRMVAALTDIDGHAVDARLLENLECVEADLLHNLLGLPQLTVRHLADQSPALFLIAGDTSFTPADKDLQRRINVDGCVNVVRAIRESARLVVHVSTAYVAGAREETIMEHDLEIGQSFRNSYEESKLAGELAVRQACDELGVPLITVRPSIIINDTRTGRSSTFTHLNALVEVVSRIQEYYGLGHGEVVSEEIRLPIDSVARPNVAPVDPIVEAFLRIAQTPGAEGKTYHLCHPSPPSNGEVISLLAMAWGVAEKVAFSFVEELTPPQSRTEKMISRSFKSYLPYLNDRSTFDITNTRAVIPEYDSMFPPLGLAYVRKVMAFQRPDRINNALSNG
jgi:nucleoside-diphosphate-sugar epimerase